MTFAELYQLDKKCRNIEDEIEAKPPKYNEGDVYFEISATSYEDFKDILKECKYLIYDICQMNVEDAVKAKKL